MDRELLLDIVTFIAGLLAATLFYFTCLVLFGDGDMPGLLYDAS